MAQPSSQSKRQIRVTVVGPCASGKTTLVESLRAQDYDAWATAQEHSAVPDLWNHQEPDAVIALQVDLATIRDRRGENWSETIYDSQIERLQHAYDHAGLVLDTGAHPQEWVLARSLDYLTKLQKAVRDGESLK